MSKIKVNVPFTVPIEIDAEDLQLDGDFVAMVRCKDCRHASVHRHDVENNRNVRCVVFGLWMEEDFFCYYGDR